MGQFRNQRSRARASNGDVQAFKEFADRIDGRSTQHVELAASGGCPIEIDSQSEWQAATLERRRQMGIEIDNKLIAAAQWILAKGNRPEAEKRYRDRMQEFHERTAAGEDGTAVLVTMKSPPVGLL